MRWIRMIGLGLTAYSAYKMMKGMRGPSRYGPRVSIPRTYSPSLDASSRPGIDLMKRHSGRRGAL